MSRHLKSAVLDLREAANPATERLCLQPDHVAASSRLKATLEFLIPAYGHDAGEEAGFF